MNGSCDPLSSRELHLISVYTCISCELLLKGIMDDLSNREWELRLAVEKKIGNCVSTVRLLGVYRGSDRKNVS